MTQPTLTIEIIFMVLDEIPLTDKPTLAACCLVSKAIFPFARARLYLDPPVLPADIFAETIKYIDVKDRATLCACCLISKDFLPLARAKLYSSLSFAIAETDGRRVTEVPDWNITSLLTPASSQLYTTLVYRPEFGLHVERAQIDDAHPAPSCSEKVEASLLRFLRRRCPRLTLLRLGISVADNQDGDTALAELGSQLHMLDRSFEADGIRMLGHLRSLKTLHGVLKSHIPPSPSAPILPPTFELLDFQTDYEIGDDVLHFVLHHSRSSLTRLELINAWWPFGEALDLSPYVALTSLSLCANGGWPICYADGNGGIMGTIKTCRNLTYLKLWGDESDEEPEDEEPFLHHLPPTLTTLVIDEIWAPYENLITDLAKDTVLPALRLLVLNNATQPYEEDSLVDGELPSWPTYNRLRGRMEQIESLCKRRSAEVSWTV